MAASALASAEFVICKKGAESLWLIGSAWEGRAAPSADTQGTGCVEGGGGDRKEDVNDLRPLAPTPEGLP